MNYTYREKLYIWLSNAFECQARAAWSLISMNGGIEELHEAVVKGKAVYPSSFRAEKRARVRQLASVILIDDYIAGLELNGVYAVTYESKNYPRLLKGIYDPPLVLYCRGKGNWEDLSLAFSIIGTRRCTEYGEKVAKMFGEALVSKGMTIVSGLAYGGDAYAAQGALKAKNSSLPTIAVLGQGVCVPKYDSTSRLMEEIMEKGIIISEMLPYSKPSKYSFPLRNRIISGLGEGLLVVEAAEKSGTMITVNSALEQGRMVFAIPGRITDVMSTGTNGLLRKGIAQAVYDPMEILEYFGCESEGLVIQKEINKKDELIKEMGVEQQKLYELLKMGEKSFDSLFEVSDLSGEDLNLYLTELEFSGLIKQLPGRVYSIE